MKKLTDHIKTWDFLEVWLHFYLAWYILLISYTKLSPPEHNKVLLMLYFSVSFMLLPQKGWNKYFVLLRWTSKSMGLTTSGGLQAGNTYVSKNFPSFCGIPTPIPRSEKFSQDHRLLIHSVIVAETWLPWKVWLFLPCSFTLHCQA